MKWLQNGNLTKLVAFFVIAVVIVCTVSFAANGWQSFVDKDPVNDTITSGGEGSEDNSDKTTGDGDGQDDIPVVQPEPKYYHQITGLETNIETSLKRPLCICLESSQPLYGVSSSYLTIEFPTEYGNTRLLCFTDEAKTLGKIGSLAPSRGYISNLASYFGGILLSYGNDDTFKYDFESPSNKLDFEDTSGYCYSEYNSFVYTNGDLVNAFLNNSSVNQTNSDKISLPYVFSNVEESFDIQGESAISISVGYGDGNTTQLGYLPSDESYVFTKDSGIKNDLLNDKPLKYENVFILYANSTTHETESSTQMILDTYTNGKGVYAYHGKYIEITWERDASGALVFYNADGEILTVDRGTSYISFVKSSLVSSVKIS